jgi:hypothetical protein
MMGRKKTRKSKCEHETNEREKVGKGKGGKR